MSPEGAKLFFVAGLSLLVGGAAGAFTTRTLYGGPIESVDPSPDRAPACPKCRECPVCPPPVDCGELGVVPVGDEPTGVVPDAVDVPEAARPGLPAAAVGLATTAVKDAVADCLNDVEGSGGHVLLSLTVTSTGGQGFIRNAEIAKTSGDVSAQTDCIVSNARRAKFEFEPEGELRFQLPLKVGP